MAETTEPQFIIRPIDAKGEMWTAIPSEAVSFLRGIPDVDRYKIEVVTTDTVKVFGHQEEVRKAIVMSAREFLDNYSGSLP